MATYKSAYSGPQIDEAVGKALNPDTTPTQNSTALITSGGVKSAFTMLTTTEDFDYTSTAFQNIQLTPPASGYTAIGAYLTKLYNQTYDISFLLRNDQYSNGWLLAVCNLGGQSGARQRGQVTIVWANV